MTESADADVIRMKTAVVILNWNTEGFLREFLPGLIASVGKVEGAEVVVADNASTDGSMKVMEEMFPNVRTIVFEKNHGFTGGYNRAFGELSGREVGKEIPGQARNDEGGGPEYFVLINSDIEVTEGWLQPLVDWMDRHPECGACAPKLHSWQEREKFEYAGAAGGYIDRFGYPFCRGRILKRLETDHGQYDMPEDVFWATGACLMVRSDVYEELGGLDPRFFAHMEEIDLCWRMQLHGYKVTVVPESVVYHVGGGTLPASSPFKLKLNYRNNLLMLEKNLAKTFALMRYRRETGDKIPGQARNDVGGTRNDVERELEKEVTKGMEKEADRRLEKAARKGCRKAGRRIFVRKCLDGLSAAVYLMTGKFSSFKAVWEAHRECRSMMGQKPGAEEIAAYLAEYGSKASVKGIYAKWIILQSLLHGSKIFTTIQKKNFYNEI